MNLLFLLSLPFIGIFLYFKKIRIIAAIIYFSIFILYPCYKEMYHGLIPIVRIAYVAGIIALYQWNVPIMIDITKKIILKDNDENIDKKYDSPFFIVIAILDILFIWAILFYIKKH